METIKKPFFGRGVKIISALILTALVSALNSYADDTATLQAKLTAGNLTLTAGATYNVTGLTVTHALNMNGATINMTATSGAGIRISAAGASVTNGTVKGTWDYTTAGSANGVIGMRILADNCTITNVHVTQFAGYGILVGAFNKPTVTGCTLDKIGYIAFYFDAETAVTTGGIFDKNVVDRSMLSPSTVQQIAVGIRGSTNNPAITTSGWDISNNTIKMPVNPANWAAECVEIRYCNNSTMHKNTIIGGSIGISIVRSSGTLATVNSFSNAQLEALEFADCTGCRSKGNIITSSSGVGILIDGANGCNGIECLNDVISGCAEECIHSYNSSQNIKITGCTLTTTTKAVNLQGTNIVTISNTTFKGNGVATLAIMLDSCPGNLILSGGTVANFTKCAIAISNTKAGLVTNNVQMSGVILTSTPSGVASYTQNGASIGSNIVVQ
ncbi:right-handed parallel beta-helix repeat-containing protein [Mucilaginibacter sp.]|jgi:parallel beta-helix repeat protein|uniref:right-handed parallel beta-helix repeat-containing protein n=1 Tax=Mucilaginibacter sp. TaxID=1882438 RepID=UPI002C0F4425|nr:right-handed parallel beta-helix repeat-containing protein [Mucilaginibacter sp.]HTI59432.1 right-handed parallel beta-helix repeat-containing protein [Mucilaginibacter sp.]